MQQLVRRWGSMSHLSLIYLDPGIGSHPDKVWAAVASIIHRR